MSTVQKSTIKIEPVNNGVQFHVSSVIFFKKNKSGLSCHVPGFNFHYSAIDEDVAKIKAKAFLKMYLDYYLVDTEKNAFKKLLVQIYKKGFRPNDPSVMLDELVSKGLKKKINFDSRNIPSPIGYDAFDKMTVDSDLLIPA